jgi:hypothetical protein
MTRIVTTAYRYKRPRKRKAVAIAGLVRIRAEPVSALPPVERIDGKLHRR